jgi:hypothetical protein
MGETPIQRIEISFAPGADDTLVQFFKGLLAPMPAETEPEPEVHTPTPYDLGLAPWVFHDPRQRCDVMAYVDDRDQVRNVPTSRATEVPASWRRVWLQPRE